MTSKVSILKAHARRWGWLRTTYHLIMRVAGSYLGIHVFAARARSTTIEVASPIKIPEIEFRKIESDALIKLTDDPELDLEREFVQAALKRGDLAFGAFDDSLLVAYVWRSTTAAPHTDNLWVKVDRPYCYSYKSLTRRDYRGNRIVPALILYSDRVMLNLKYTHRVGFIAITNFASLAMGAHMGTRTIGHIGYLEWFGRYFHFRTKSVAEIGAEFFEPDNSRESNLLRRN